VPEINVQVQRVQGTSAGQSINTNADMFGGLEARQAAIRAQTMGTMVKGLTGLGSTVLGHLEAQKKEEDTLLVDQLDYEFSRRLQEERLSYAQMQGNQAMDSFEPYTRRLDELNEEYSQRLKNDDQKRLWQQRYQRASLSHHNYLGNHYVQEKQRFQVTQNAMLIDQKVSLASEAFLSGDETAKALAMDEALRAMESGLRLHGQHDPAIVASKSEELYSTVVQRTVEQLLANNQTDQAVALYNQELDNLGAKTRDSLEPKVRKLEREIRWDGLASDFLQSREFANDKDRLDAIHELPGLSDEDRSQVRARVTAQIKAAKEQRQLQIEGLKTGLQEQIAAAGYDLTRIDPYEWDQFKALSPKEASELQKWAAQHTEGTFTTDPDAYIQLQAGLASGEFKKPGWTEQRLRSLFGTRVRKADLDSAIESLNGTAKIPDQAFNTLAQRYLRIATKDLTDDKKLAKFERFKDELKALAERNGDYSDKALDRYAAYLVEKDDAPWYQSDTTRLDALMDGDADWTPATPGDEAKTVNGFAEYLKVELKDDAARDRFYQQTYQPLKMKMDTLLDKYPSLRGMNPYELMQRIAEHTQETKNVR
jgi:hypothetical protein